MNDEMEGIKNELKRLSEGVFSVSEGRGEPAYDPSNKYSDKLRYDSVINEEVRKEIVDKALPMIKQEVDRYRSVVITGVKESTREMHQDREIDDDRSILGIFKAMGQEWAHYEITSKYRLGRYNKQESGPRPVKVTFASELTQREVLKHTWTLKQNDKLARVYIRRDLTKEERRKINKSVEETRKRNNERTEQQKSEFFWKRNGLMEPQKVFLRAVGGGEERGRGMR